MINKMWEVPPNYQIWERFEELWYLPLFDDQQNMGGTKQLSNLGDGFEESRYLPLFDDQQNVGGTEQSSNLGEI